jgi:hypothetical protein
LLIAPRAEPYERHYRIRLPPWRIGERCCYSHTVQSLGHSVSALCRASVGLNDVLLGPRPFLPRLRRRSLSFVRLVHRYYGAVRLLRSVRVRRVALRLRGPGLVPFWAEALQRSPGSRACCFSACPGSPTTQDRLLARVYRETAVLPSSNQERVGVLVLRFSKAQ